MQTLELKNSLSSPFLSTFLSLPLRCWMWKNQREGELKRQACGENWSGETWGGVEGEGLERGGGVEAGIGL